MKIAQALEDSNVLLKGVTETVKKGFLTMLLRTLGENLLGNLLTGKVVVRAGYGNKNKVNF